MIAIQSLAAVKTPGTFTLSTSYYADFKDTANGYLYTIKRYSDGPLPKAVVPQDPVVLPLEPIKTTTKRKQRGPLDTDTGAQKRRKLTDRRR